MMHHDTVSSQTMTPIEDWVLDLANKPNIQVIAFFDCCRNYLTLPKPDMKAAQPFVAGNNVFIGFGCRRGKKAAFFKDE